MYGVLQYELDEQYELGKYDWKESINNICSTFNLTQIELAVILGISPGTLTNLKSGKLNMYMKLFKEVESKYGNCLILKGESA